MKAKPPVQRCELCRRNPATVFVLMRHEEFVEKGQICRPCFYRLQQLQVIKTTAVGFRQFHETLTSSQLIRN